MDENFMSCLKRIVELEKISITQQKTQETMRKQISRLGNKKYFKKPQKQTVTQPTIPYRSVDSSFNTAWIRGSVIICALIMGLIFGIKDFYESSEGFLFALIGAVLVFFKYALIGCVIGLPVGAILGAISSSSAENRNYKAQKQAEEESQRLYNEAQQNADNQYEIAINNYNQMLKKDSERVANELEQADILNEILQKLEIKHEETCHVLAQLYDAAEIHPLYRNYIAMCYFLEYLESGVCSELKGPHGAMMVFKYEMYEQKKIQQIETVINQLYTLHFDNVALNKGLESINSSVASLTGVVQEVKQAQMENAKKNETMLQSLGSQISSYQSQIIKQNSVIEYNTSCAAYELNQLKWLETFQALKA